MPLQRIVENYLTVTYISQAGQVETTKYRDNLFNRVWALKNDGVKDVAIQSGEYIKKDFNVIHVF